MTQTQLKHTVCIGRLILVLAMATDFAVSTALQPDDKQLHHTPKNLSQPEIPLSGWIKAYRKSNRP